MLRQVQFDSLGRKMNDYDWENLQFLLNADEETLRDWYDKVDVEDHEYASELMTAYSEELKVKEILITDKEIKKFEEASGILARYRK
jgi:hypothetical protein